MVELEKNGEKGNGEEPNPFTSTDSILLPTTDDDINGLPVPVQDLHRDLVKIGEEYIIHTLLSNGKIYLIYVENTTCPNGIIEISGYYKEGTPVRFFTKNPTRPAPFNVVRETNDINIMFSDPTTTSLCVNESVWKVSDPDIKAKGLRFVVTGGTLGNISSWFKIEKFKTERPGSYKLTYCPTCSINDCEDMGVQVPRLALTNKPLSFGFKKVKKSDA
ncbi:cysteine protease inhibitor 5-like [Lycium barbarum]|uniref:cysteine protease inhibitor 5-like n=1 Tax=Lycium barbarum TaxID=112863 RepID=UPI00293E3F79|nr:cysteine protease inhibitor 5-like [Lycium barbarum]